MARKPWGPKGSEEHRKARAEYMRGYRKGKGREICKEAVKKWREKNLERAEAKRKAYVESPRGRQVTRAIAARYTAKLHSEGWTRCYATAPCIACSKLTVWRVKRLAILANNRTATRWVPCCRGC